MTAAVAAATVHDTVDEEEELRPDITKLGIIIMPRCERIVMMSDLVELF